MPDAMPDTPATEQSKKKKEAGGRWFRGGLRFECACCAYCCSGEPGDVWVTSADIERIAARLGMTARDVADAYLAKRGSRYSIRERPNGECAFLERGRCRIYAVRPAQCVTYPFWRSILASERYWEEEKKYCPGIGKGKLYTAGEIEEFEKAF